MRIFLTEQEVLDLATDYLDLMNPNPDKIHDIAARMDMQYNEDIDLFEDIEQVSMRRYRKALKFANKMLKSF